MAPMRPEQCNVLNDWSFFNQAWLATYEIPTYRDWLFNADYRPAFEAHRRTLQHLQWRTPARWVLKYPKHLLTLDALLETYPDARLVWTHRDPAVVLPSVVQLHRLHAFVDPGIRPGALRAGVGGDSRNSCCVAASSVRDRRRRDLPGRGSRPPLRAT